MKTKYFIAALVISIFTMVSCSKETRVEPTKTKKIVIPSYNPVYKDRKPEKEAPKSPIERPIIQNER